MAQLAKGTTVKVKDLIAKLQEFDPETDIWGAEPSDGNGPISLIEPEVGFNSVDSGSYARCKCPWASYWERFNGHIDTPTHWGSPAARAEVAAMRDAGTYSCHKCGGTGKLWLKVERLFVGWF